MPEAEETWRLFVAMPLAEGVAAAAARAQAALQRAVPQAGIRWTPAHQFHLTLRFLGEVAAAQAAALEAGLQSACAAHAPLQLHLRGVGFFPQAQRPRVVWLGVEGQLEGLRALQADVARAVAPFIAEPEPEAPESFSAHITLGRVKHLSPRERALLVAAAQQCAQGPAEPWPADRVQLMRSRLGAGGAQHECLAVWRLRPRKAEP